MKKKYLLLILLLLIMPCTVFGLEVSCSENSIKVGTSTSCTVTDNSEGETTEASTISVSVDTPDVLNSDKSSIVLDENKSARVNITGIKAGTGVVSFNDKKVTITVEEEQVVAPNINDGNEENGNDNKPTTGDNESNDSGNKPTNEENKQEEKKCILDSLSISSGSINFDPNKKEYDVTLDSNVNSFKVTVPKGIKVKYNPSDSINLKYGEKKSISVIVLCDNSETTYKINVTRKDVNDEDNTKKANVDLKKLTIDGIPFDFTPSKTVYSLTVPISVEEVKIDYELEDKNATAKIVGDTKLKEGKNQIKIVITAQNGMSNTYILNINRSDSQIIVNNNESEILKAIKDELNKSDIYVNVERLDKKIISKEILEALIKSKKIITYSVLNNDDEIVYTVTLDGKKINNTDEFNYQLTFISENEDELLKLVNSNKYLSFRFKNSNKFPGDIDLKIYTGDRAIANEKTVNLYKYNSNELKLLNKNIKIEDDYISVTVDSNDEYIFANVTKSKEVNNSYTIPVIAAALIVLILIILIFIIVKKKKSKNKKIYKKETEIEQ